MEWEVDAATGNDANGGGFDPVSGTPGTNYAWGAGQVVYSYTDIVIGAVDTTGTSVGRAFSAADVGNILNVTAGTGFTVQRVQIMSVTAGIATFDKSLGTAASTGGTGKLGGSLLTVGIAGSVGVLGNEIWVKYNASSYLTTSTTSNISNGRITLASTGASSVSFVTLRGYDTTHGDETSNRPTLSWGLNATTNFIITIGGYGHVENMIINGNSYTGSGIIVATTNVPYFVRRVWLKNMTGGTAVLGGGSRGMVLNDVEVSGCSIPVYNTNGGTTAIDGLHVHDCTNSGISVTGGITLFAKNIILDTCKSTTSYSGIVIANASNIYLSNITVHNSGSYGIDLQAVCAGTFINVHCENNGGYGINLSAINPDLLLLNCSGYNNTSGNYDSSKLLARNIVNFVAITDGEPLTDPDNATPASNDFTPNATASRGALLRKSAFPAKYPGLTIGNYPDIGAVQHQDSETGSSTIINVME